MDNPSIAHADNGGQIIHTFVEVGKINLYLVNSKGECEAQYYGVTELDKIDDAVKEVEDYLFSLAKDNDKKINKTALNEWCSKFEIEGETEYSIQIFVGTAICTSEEFEDAKSNFSIKQMLENIQKE